jgi:hypothetical protein
MEGYRVVEFAMGAECTREVALPAVVVLPKAVEWG